MMMNLRHSWKRKGAGNRGWWTRFGALGLCAVSLMTRPVEAATGGEDRPPVLAAAASADAGARREQWAAEVSQMIQRLDLSEDQRAKVEPILRENAAKRRAVVQKYQGQSGLKALRELRKEMEPIRKDTETRLASVLSPAQMKEFREIRKELQDKVRAELRQRRK